MCSCFSHRVHHTIYRNNSKYLDGMAKHNTAIKPPEEHHNIMDISVNSGPLNRFSSSYWRMNTKSRKHSYSHYFPLSLLSLSANTNSVIHVQYNSLHTDNNIMGGGQEAINIDTTSKLLKSEVLKKRDLNPGATVDLAIPLRPLKGKSDKNPVKHFVDCVEVSVEAGHGGEGRISFLSVYAVEFAGPDGGDGGHGAHVIFRARDQVRDLSHIKRKVIGKYGGPGRNKNMAGKDASHLYIDVPTGTLLRNMEGEVVGDLDMDGASFIAARGGAGGKGNAHFKTSVRQAPEIAESGAEGEKYNYTLELRTMADVGLIGFPNAGKSTLLTAISRARPKIASYPFTTLRPHLGIVQYSDLTQLAVADLPGLLPGAHRNHGLGIDFLRHIQRCSVLVFVLDMEQEEPWEQLDQLKFELEMYQEGLASRPAAILANKMDVVDAEEKLMQLSEMLGKDLEVIPVSGRTGINLATMLVRLKRLHDQYSSQ